MVTRRGAEQFLHLQDTLARVELSDGLPIGDLLMAESGRLPRDSTLILIAPEVSDELALVLATLKEIGFAVTVLIVMNNEGYTLAQQRLMGANIDVLHIEDVWNLSEIVTGKVYL